MYTAADAVARKLFCLFFRSRENDEFKILEAEMRSFRRTLECFDMLGGALKDAFRFESFGRCKFLWWPINNIKILELLMINKLFCAKNNLPSTWEWKTTRKSSKLSTPIATLWRNMRAPRSAIEKFVGSRIDGATTANQIGGKKEKFSFFLANKTFYRFSALLRGSVFSAFIKTNMFTHHVPFVSCCRFSSSPSYSCSSVRMPRALSLRLLEKLYTFGCCCWLWAQKLQPPPSQPATWYASIPMNISWWNLAHSQALLMA